MTRTPHPPLAGVRALVTRARTQAGALTRRLRESGATVVELPTIELQEPEDWGPADAAIANLGSYDLGIFTSANGVERFVRRLREQGTGPEALAGIRLAAIGPATAAALEAEGLSVEHIPDEYRAEAVLAAVSGVLGRHDSKAARVLIPRALVARDVLPDGLREVGAYVDVVPVYRTVVPEESRARSAGVFRGGVDLITFTSSSTVRNFVAMVGRGELQSVLDGVVVACIGPITAATARQEGMSVDVEPRDYTINGLADAIDDFFAGRESSTGPAR